MKPTRQFVIRFSKPTRMRELEAGDHPYDREGRELPFVPGDFLVESPFQSYVLSRELTEMLYVEVEDGHADHDADRG
jgi:hypothetical protein